MANHPLPYPHATPVNLMGENGNGTRYVTWREFEDWRDDLRHQMRDLKEGQTDIGRKIDDFIVNFHKGETNELRQVLRAEREDMDEHHQKSWATKMAVPGWIVGIGGLGIALGAIIMDIISRT